MTKDKLKGLVILMKSDKSLLQTKKIRIYQREKLVDKLHFLIPLQYEDWDGRDEEHPDMSVFTVVLQYIGQDGTIHAETLDRLKSSDDDKEYEDYIDGDGNATHMIYCLPIDTNLTKFAGDITVKLNLQYISYAGATSSFSDEEEAEDPVAIQYILNTDDTIIKVLPVADYYSIVPDESLSEINNKIAELSTKLQELEATADTYDAEKADNIKLDEENNVLYLTNGGKQIGDAIDMESLGNEIAENTPEGLVTVVI